MKKIILLMIIVIGAAVFIYAMRDKLSGDGANSPAVNENRSGTFRPDPSNATFTFDDGEVTLSAGRNERSITPDGNLTEETVLLDKFAYGDINVDGKEDALLFLARYGGGSGTFIYLAAFVSGPVTYRGSEAVFIGDRVTLKSLSVSGNTVTVRYLDRGAGEPFAAEPTIPVSKQFTYQNGRFEER